MTNSELKLSKKIAFDYLYGMNNILLGKKFNFDGRTIVGKLANQIVQSEINKIDKKAILLLRKNRRELKFSFVPMLKSPIVNDYILHKYNLNGVFLQNLSFLDGRKHWAKNETDLKILSILRKNYLIQNNLN